MAPDHICTLPESGAIRAGENRRHEQPDGGRGTIDDDVREASSRRLGAPRKPTPIAAAFSSTWSPRWPRSACSPPPNPSTRGRSGPAHRSSRDRAEPEQVQPASFSVFHNGGQTGIRNVRLSRTKQRCNAFAARGPILPRSLFSSSSAGPARTAGTAPAAPGRDAPARPARHDRGGRDRPDRHHHEPSSSTDRRDRRHASLTARLSRVKCNTVALAPQAPVCCIRDTNVEGVCLGRKRFCREAHGCRTI